MKTVFILGAGASQPYGLPSGYELVNAIIKVLAERTQNFLYWGFSDRQVDIFKEAIIKSSPSAIDDLIIERSNDFLAIGKLAIAQALVRYERDDKLFDRTNNCHWYQHFFDHLKSLPMPLSVDQYSFITFNYDRSLEHYLHEATVSHYADSMSARLQSILNIPIIHVHGQLGILPSKGGACPYAPNEERSYVVSISQGLRLVDEEADSKLIAEAQLLIQRADRIRFLGFGFHDSNLEKLGFDANSQMCNDVTGTAKGKTEAEIRLIARRHPKLKNVDTHDRDILKFFRESYPLDL